MSGPDPIVEREYADELAALHREGYTTRIEAGVHTAIIAHRVTMGVRVTHVLTELDLGWWCETTTRALGKERTVAASAWPSVTPLRAIVDAR